MNLKDQLASLQESMESTVNAAKAENRDLTKKEAEKVVAKGKEAEALQSRIESIEKSEKALADLVGLGNGGLSDDGGHLAFTGRGAKAASSMIGGRIREAHWERGFKAFTGHGQITTSVPLIPATPVEQGRAAVSILELLPTHARQTPHYNFLRQTVFDNKAAIVAPGDEKPVSTMSVETVEAELRVFAHLSEPVDKYVLQDNDTLAAFISRQLLWGLQVTLQDEIVNGEGDTGDTPPEPHLVGLLATDGIQTQTAGADRVTTLRAASTKLEVLGFETGAFILSSTDWEAIETARSTSGSFDLGGPVDRAARKVWGVPVVTSPSLTDGQAVALDLSTVEVDYGAEGIQIEWDASGELFEKNQVRVRVEGRFGLSVTQPQGVVSVALEA